jgi:polyphosphate:AMP phosphotransferase
MFETLEVGKQLSADDFSSLQQPLREALLKAQFSLADADYPVIILVAGADGAGKGSVVHRLNEWMDPRRITTNAFWLHSDEEESRPFFWRFWRVMPPRGQIGIFFGSWYSEPIKQAVAGRFDDTDVADACRQIERFERMLSDDGALIIKLWFHVSAKTQRMQLAEEAPREQQNLRVPVDPGETLNAYHDYRRAAEKFILGTDSSHSPWHLIEAEDRYYRDIAAGRAVLSAMESHATGREEPRRAANGTVLPGDFSQPTVLDKVDLSRQLARPQYKKELRQYQARLQDLAWQAHRQQCSWVAIFEGWDAAGKGSAIRRVTNCIDPRLYHLVQIAAPSDEEAAHHYLWRFWRQLERDGRATLFDRSWYGRVLVERVEGFARPAEWQRAYGEINQFEQQLVDHGSVLAKFWIHISPEEQLSRFHAREQVPHKQHKIIEDDWRNREKRREYEQAVDAMVTHTSTEYAPWTLVSGDDKRYARIQILKTLCDGLQSRLGKRTAP